MPTSDVAGGRGDHQGLNPGPNPNQVEEKITKDQRKYLLNEQLKKIKKELGMEKDEKEGALERWSQHMP